MSRASLFKYEYSLEPLESKGRCQSERYQEQASSDSLRRPESLEETLRTASVHVT